MSRTNAIALILLAFSTTAALAADILVHDEKAQPESLTVAPNGDVIVGSSASPFIYRIRKGATSTEVFTDATAEGPGTNFLGQLADPATNTLWACQLTPAPAPVMRHSFLRGFDMTTAKEKIRWAFPDDGAVCNDMVVGPDKALYITDTTNAKIYRMAPGATTADLFLDNHNLMGVDGIAFIGNTLYVTNIFFNKLYRIPVDANGKAGAPVDIWMDMPVRGPDGMRAVGDKLFLVEGQNGRIDSLTVNSDTAHVTVLKDGFHTPTGVAPFGDTVWVSERVGAKVSSFPMPK